MSGAPLSDRHREEISRRLRPVRPPRVLDEVLQEGQLATVLGLIRRHGPWDLILKHHFRSLEELVATTSGGRLPALLTRLEAAGGSVHAPMREMPDLGIRVAFAADPEGHLAELVQVLG